MILGGFGQLKTKPNKANLIRIAYCVLRIAERKKAKMSVNLEFFDYFLVFIRVNSWLFVVNLKKQNQSRPSAGNPKH